MAGNNGGPWGGGGNNQGGGGNRGNNNGNGQRPPQGDGPQIPDIDDLMKKGQDQLRVLMGGRGGGGGQRNGGGAGGQGGPGLTKGTVAIGALVAAGLWAMASFYTVKPEEKSVELFLGEYSATGNPGLNFAPWPLVTAEVLPVTNEQTEDIPTRGSRTDGLMLTGDENIVDIDFQVVWNISDPAQYLFNLRDPQETIRAVSESAMREIIAQSELAPVLNRDRGIITDRLQESIQTTLDTYNSGVNIVRVNFDGADPPEEVKDAFREVQSASQERDRLEKQADAYSNRVTAGARGEAAQILEEAEAYRAQVVNQAQGEASRFSAVLEEYAKAPDVTRKRLYLETMEEVLGGIDKVIIDENTGDQGVVPYLPLNELRKGNN
ncbi:FtsH protease activity modulator HflK [Shimia sp. R9_2]|uniref:FtsH protease activity modulator HflK n=1 Tax=unclassified Shimia TaxID=2630038 RepID=UPI001ADAF0D1|nr:MULTISPECIES: FtsH protease activity modulator HflK [unclassified Shimia]MBO9398895.1 FtsH protease activity modulator HflK [Shimia sp. R9_2]MBO9402950.1 FtsH protease activity modulator HflK [Shimia sp. R9_3]